MWCSTSDVEERGVQKTKMSLMHWIAWAHVKKLRQPTSIRMQVVPPNVEVLKRGVAIHPPTMPRVLMSEVK